MWSKLFKGFVTMNILITKNGEELIQKTTDRINEKIIKIFKKTDPKNMSGIINIIESL